MAFPLANARGADSVTCMAFPLANVYVQLDKYASLDWVKNSISTTQLKRNILIYKGMELDYCKMY